MHHLALNIPNFLEFLPGDFWKPAGRLIWSTVILVIGVGIIFVLAKRPKSPEPTTWAMSMLGAIAVTGLMIIAYGTIPHEWLQFADSYLKWDAANYFIRSGDWFFSTDVNKAAAKDTVAVLIYAVFLGLNVYLFSLWQKRPVATDVVTEPTTKSAGTSAYGRPMTTKA